MKLKYRISDGTCLAMGDMPNLYPFIGEAVEDYSGEIPALRLDFFKRVAPNLIIEKSDTEKALILANDNIVTSKMNLAPLQTLIVALWKTLTPTEQLGFKTQFDALTPELKTLILALYNKIKAL